MPTMTIKDKDISGVLDSAIPTVSGSQFLGWNTKADGTGETYQSGATLPDKYKNKDVDLYAIWRNNNDVITQIEAIALKDYVIGDTVALEDIKLQYYSLTILKDMEMDKEFTQIFL